MSNRSIQDILSDALDQDFLALVENISHGEALSTLGLKSGHSDEELKSAYRKASKSQHPDVGGSVEGMKRVNAAYQKLKSSTSNDAEDSLLKASRHSDPDVRFDAAKHPHLKSHHIHAILDKELEHGNDDTLASSVVFKHPSIDSSHIDKAMKHWDEDIRHSAISHPKSEERHVDMAMQDEDSYVRTAAVKHPKVKMRHIEKAIQDEDEDVRSAAVEHLRKRGVFKD